MKLLRLAALAAVVSLAACSSSPTQSAPAGADAPSFNEGGNGLGSGNYQDPPEPGYDTAASDTTNNGRGGNMIGSGN